MFKNSGSEFVYTEIVLSRVKKSATLGGGGDHVTADPSRSYKESGGGDPISNTDISLSFF